MRCTAQPVHDFSLIDMSKGSARTAIKKEHEVINVTTAGSSWTLLNYSMYDVKYVVEHQLNKKQNICSLL